MKKQLIFLATCLLLSRSAVAMFCPNGFNQINMGDTLEEVQRQCGKPDVQTEEKSDANTPQQWQYYVKSDPSNPATMNLSVAFANGKVTNLTANATSLTSTPLCSGGSVSIGDTPEHVKAACGAPAFMQKGQSSGPQTITTRLKYNTTPPVILTFVNDKLTKRE